MLTVSAADFKVTIQPVGLTLGGGRVDITGGVIGGRGHALLWDGAGHAPENWKIASTTAQGKADRAKAKPLMADALETCCRNTSGSVSDGPSCPPTRLSGTLRPRPTRVVCGGRAFASIELSHSGQAGRSGSGTPGREKRFRTRKDFAA